VNIHVVLFATSGTRGVNHCGGVKDGVAFLHGSLDSPPISYITKTMFDIDIADRTKVGVLLAEDAHVVAERNEAGSKVRPNETRAAGNENVLHLLVQFQTVCENSIATTFRSWMI
jgi:hypothetical protein